LYGTTEGGGARSSGTIFSIAPSGSEKTLYTFQDNPDGNGPGADLIYYSGNLYGTTIGGGTQGDGTVFKVTTSGTETVLYSFLGGSDGKDPQGPVYLYNSELYGTTYQGGGTNCTSGTGCGTIFKLNP
ncbi:MAG: choice-of-anchor tandem repeat GloVer-containing protein, partial [Candidatus Cybelea sp.]